VLSINEVNFIVSCSACRREKFTFAISSPDELMWSWYRVQRLYTVYSCTVKAEYSTLIIYLFTVLCMPVLLVLCFQQLKERLFW